MNWGEFKKCVEDQGVNDNTVIRWIDLHGPWINVKFIDTRSSDFPKKSDLRTLKSFVGSKSGAPIESVHTFIRVISGVMVSSTSLCTVMSLSANISVIYVIPLVY